MQSSSTRLDLAIEARTLYIKWTYISRNPIYHDILQDYYLRVFGINLDLCPCNVIEHCEWLKQNLERLYCHCRIPNKTDDEHIEMLDGIIKQLKLGAA